MKIIAFRVWRNKTLRYEIFTILKEYPHFYVLDGGNYKFCASKWAVDHDVPIDIYGAFLKNGTVNI